MKGHLLGVWDDLRNSFWFVPTLMVAGSVVLSIVTLLIDYSPVGSRLAREFSWIWSGQADGARSVLSTIASSMITVAGTVFSITIAALALTSSQFGPRLLRNFTRDVGNQVVLGTFLATFLYSLLILRTVHDGQGGQGGGFVPNLSVTAAVALAAASTGVLIYFIHHLTGSIQAETLIAAVAEDLKADIARLRPPAPPGPGSTPMDRRDATPRAKPALVHSTASGYLRHVDRDGLVEAGDEYDMLIRMAVRPGDFVSEGQVLIEAWPHSGRLADQIIDDLRDACAVGDRRTNLQDVRYGVQQLTQIAARALSPGINDPSTAIGCTDWLMDSLADMAQADLPSGIRMGASGTPRLLEDPVAFSELVRLAVGPIRAYGARSVMVTEHLLWGLAHLAQTANRPEDRQAVLKEAELTAEAAFAALSSPDDHRRVQQALDAVRRSQAAS